MKPGGCFAAPPRPISPYYIGPLHRRVQGITKTLVPFTRTGWQENLRCRVAVNTMLKSQMSAANPVRQCAANRAETGKLLPERLHRGRHSSGSFWVRFGLVLRPLFIFNNIGRFVFSFVLGSFLPQLCVFNNFSASFLGSFRFVFGHRSFIFNNLSGSFFKKVFFFCFCAPRKPFSASPDC
jgi:hypothetical protein